MFREYLAAHGSILPTIGTVILFALFAAVYVYVITDRRRAHNDRMSRLALDEEENRRD
jgi:cbb3-type cytochrome oxidase subunit 3